jgi:tetratricopeptide (TPR) repeat protein
VPEPTALLLIDHYRIERELGRGGMATVYLAHDLRHERQVALKALRPEISGGLGLERFLREVRLTARLQHPHILPIFDSGAVDGRPWYTMPYVKGESLRDRLEREGQLAVPVALDITRQVAQALAYAHGEGVVHRDIKPENILLGGGQAMVADFGIARALEVVGDERLTESGLSLGTPSYMAPEQASGGRIDARTDVYALGCVLYEMLAGEPPFTGPTVQAIIAKRLGQPPPSVRVLRPIVPVAVDQAILHALATLSADRFSSAEEFVRALDGAVSGAVAPAAAAPERTPVRARRLPARWLFALAAVAAVAVGYFVVRALGIGVPSTLLATGILRPRDRMIVAEFTAHGPDSLMGPAVTDAFRTDFAQSSVVTTLSPPQVAEALERMRRPTTSRLDPVLAREVAIRQGVKAIVTGEISPLGKAYVITAQLVSPESGEVLAAERETAEDDGKIIAAVDRLSAQLRGRIGESLKSIRAEPPLDRVTTNSLQALEKYNQALYAAHVKGDFPKTITLLEEAVALDTGFATAYRSLGGFLWLSGQRERAIPAFNKALQYSERLTDQEREHTLALYYHFVTAEYDKAIAHYRAALERNPTDSMMANLGAVYMTLDQPAPAESLFQRQIAWDSLHPWEGVSLVYWHLVRAQVALGKLREAKQTYERMIERYADTTRHVIYVGIMLPEAVGDYRTAEARVRLFKERHRDIEDQRSADRDLAALASARGRLDESGRHRRDAMAASAAEPNPVAYLEDAVSLALLDIWFRRRVEHGLEVTEAALRRFPLTSIKPMDRPYLALAFIYASAGKPEQARTLLAEYERAVNPIYRRVDEYQRRWVRGIVALAEKHFVDAIGEFQAFAASPRDCKPCGLAALGQAYDRAGQLDSAIAVYERYVMTPDLGRLDWVSPLNDDATQLAPAHKRLGELYELRGDRARAREHYARFVELWRDCDPELKPAVVEVTRRLRDLDTGESGAH